MTHVATPLHFSMNLLKMNIPKLFRKKRFYVLVFTLGFILFAYQFLELRYSDRTMVRKLAKNVQGYTATVHHYDTLNRHMRYVEIGDDKKPLLMFLHGAPSSSSFWKSYLRDSTLLATVKMLAPDRPGYGYSGFGKAETSIKKQAALVAKILKSKRKLHDIIILHGSSYGGTLAARLAMDYPDLVDGVIFQSASLAPGEETIYSITHPTSKWPLKHLIPTTLRIANEEKLSHEKELEKMAELWDNIKAAVIILQGTSDNLIWPSNATYAKEKLVNAAYVDLVWAEGQGHNLTWTKKELILSSIQKMVKLAGAKNMTTVR